jgi:hypothetical protein
MRREIDVVKIRRGRLRPQSSAAQTGEKCQDNQRHRPAAPPLEQPTRILSLPIHQGMRGS